jgi:dolichol-phosphate mannosyltransferase
MVADAMMALSVVIPVRNEAENIAALARELNIALSQHIPFETIFVDDGSSDDSVSVLEACMQTLPQLRIVRHDWHGGQSAAIHSGVLAARAPIICTLDGDGQNPPEELPRLVTVLLNDTEGRVGLVAGQRVARRDPLSKRLASRFANSLRAWVLQDTTRDTGCGLKAFRRDAFLRLPYFDHMHRYLPALSARDGWEIAHVDVSHRPRLGAVRQIRTGLDKDNDAAP